ncbi:MAG: dTDP-4-dehydrorhamnose reductase [Candidatus Kerfeldbacteria bacterium]|nr:dTDP-4-dehydrorhamnose reductase [Candidatus Kerfeldbacteria bacterium]
MSTLVLFGGNGMLGQALQQALSGHTLHVLTHHEVDITDAAAVDRALQTIRPDYLINAAAYTKVDDCETQQELALRSNGLAPGILAVAAKQHGCTLIHFSTDYIFSGTKPEGYQESDSPDQPVNYYGQTKLAGEQAIRAAGLKEYYIIRTAWLYGAHGINFVDTMLTLAKTKSQLQVVNDQHGSPTYTVDLAVATKQFVEQALPYGIYHLTNTGDCTWYEFATEIFRQAKLPVRVEPCTSAAFPRPAKRPTYSILLNTKLAPLRPWQAALADYLSTVSG